MPISASDLIKAGNYARDRYVTKTPVSQIDIETPLIKKLDAKKKSFKGTLQYINCPIRKERHTSGQFYYGADTVTYGDSDPVAHAKYTWTSFFDGFTINEDEALSAGISFDVDKPNSTASADEAVALVNLMGEKMTSLRDGMLTQTDQNLHMDGTQDAQAVAGLDAIIDLDPTTGVIGGFDRATSTWWRNHTNATAGTGSTLLNNMELAWRACSKNGGKPDFILVGQAFYDAYRSATSGSIVINANTGANGASLDGAISDLTFRGVPLVIDYQFEAVQGLTSATTDWDNRCYFINTKHMTLMKMDGHDMKLRTPSRGGDKFVAEFGMSDKYSLTCNRMNAHAVLAV
jgi:hypothetical protein